MLNVKIRMHHVQGERNTFLMVPLVFLYLKGFSYSDVLKKLQKQKIIDFHFWSWDTTTTTTTRRSWYNVLYRGFGKPYVSALYMALYSVGQGGLPTPECMYQSQNRKGCEILTSCVFYFNYLMLLIFKVSDIIVRW